MKIQDKSSDEEIRILIEDPSIEGEKAVELKNICKEKIAESARDLYISLPNTKYMDSATIGTLLYMIQVLKKEGKDIYIESTTEELKQLLKSLLLDQFLNIS